MVCYLCIVTLSSLACYNCTFSLIFFLLGSIQVIIFITLSDVCKETETAPAKLQNTIGAGNLPNLPITNQPIDIKNITNSIFTCQGNSTYLDAVGYTKESLGVNRVIDTAREQSKSALNQTSSADSLLNNAKSQATSFSQNLTSIPSFSTLIQNITDYQKKLDDLFGQSFNLSRYGFDQNKLDNSLAGLNNLTQRAGEFYTINNISLLDTNKPAYVSLLSQSERQVLNQTRDEVVGLVAKYNSTLITLGQVQVNITLIGRSLNNTKLNVQIIQNIVNSLYTIPNQVVAEIDKIGVAVNGVRTNATAFIDKVINNINGAIDDALVIARCGPLGNTLRTVKDSVCVKLAAYDVVLAIDCFIIAVLMVIWFPWLLLAAKRFFYPIPNVEYNTNGDPMSTFSQPPTTQDQPKSVYPTTQSTGHGDLMPDA